MSLRVLLMRRVSGVLLCCGVWMPGQCVMAQQVISNPLVRPAGLGAGGASGGGGAAAQKTEAQNAAAQPPASPDLRDKAASRLSQEDFNLKQQALNASAIPAPLGSLFNQMMVSAVVGGSVVLRRSDGVLNGQQAVQASSAGSTGGQANNGGSRGSSGLGVAGGAVVTSSVLRLRVGQSTNLNGYVLRARVEGMDVFVDWKNEQGAWVGVFFGALESSGGLVLTPAKDTLEKVDTSSFDYLKPQVSNRVSGNNNGTTGANGQNGLSNNSGLGSTGSSGTGSAASF